MKIYNNEILNDCSWFAEKHRGKNKQSGPHWSTIIRFTPLFDEAARLQQRVDALEAIIFEVNEMLKNKQARVQELEQERWWISVDEKRPENWEKVIVLDSQNGTLFSRFNGIKFLTIAEDKTIDDVIFWQPLPHPPKDGE